MAILKDLIVHGSSRFLNKIYASEIQTPLIETEAGVIKKLKADDATVVGLLDVKGQLHTNSWSNSNIATIDGSFYITPTIGSDSGTVSITASSLTFSGTNYAVSSLYLGDGSSITWPQYSKVLVTGQVLLNGEWIPLGTLLGQINGVATAASISINNIKDNKKPPSNTSNVYTTLVNSGVSSTNYRNLKISLYQRAAGQTDFRPLGIYMTATGTNGRTFLDIYGGVEALSTNNNYGGFAEPNVRIGNLQGLPNVGGQTPSGWGIYTDNGYFKGIIAADKGYIGSGSRYWVIANYEDDSNPNNSRSYIYSYNGTDNGTNSIASTVEGIYLGTDGIRNYKDSTHNVTIANGVITALGVNLTGEIIASSGSIGGWNIGTDTNKSLYYGNQIPGATTTNLILSPTSATNSNAIGGSGTGLRWFISAGKVFGVTTAGALYATSGKIGGWTLNTNGFYITNSTPGYNANTLVISKGTASTKAIGGSDTTSKNWMISAGTGFGVTTTGVLYANNVHISGEITATSGTIGGIQLDNNGKLWIKDANISGTISSNHIDVSSISIGDLSGEIGGRNYVKNSNVTLSGVSGSIKGGTLSQMIPEGTIVTVSIQVDADNIVWDNSATWKRLGFEISFPKSTSGNQYVGAWAGSALSESSNIVKAFQGSFHGRISKTFVLQGDMIVTKYPNMYLQGISSGSAAVSKIKIEIGNKATDFTLAPEDIQESVNNAAKTATSYITYINANDGIKIHNAQDTLNYLQLNSDAISMFRDSGDGLRSDEVLRIDNTGIRIGKDEGPHFSLINDKIIGYGNNDNIYFEVGKGNNVITQLFFGNGSRTSFEIGPRIKQVIKVKKGNNIVTEGTDYNITVASIWYNVYFKEKPDLNSTITVSYKNLYKDFIYTVSSSDTEDVIRDTYVKIKTHKEYEAEILQIKKSGNTTWSTYNINSNTTLERENLVAISLATVPAAGKKVYFYKKSGTIYLLGTSTGQTGQGGDLFYLSSATEVDRGTIDNGVIAGPYDHVFIPLSSDEIYPGSEVATYPSWTGTYEGDYIYSINLSLDTGDQIKLSYNVEEHPDLTPDTTTKNYTWDSTHNHPANSMLSIPSASQLISISVNGVTLSENIDYVTDNNLKVGYLTFNTAPSTNEKIEIEFVTQKYNSYYDSTYFNFSNMNSEDAIKGIGAASFGSDNINKGIFCLAEGVGNIVTGYASHVEGCNNIATGSHTHVGGSNSFASGENAFVHGDNLKATYLNSAAFGYYNSPDDQVFSIGKGGSKNSFSINKDGNIQFGGQLLAGTTYADKKPLFTFDTLVWQGQSIPKNGSWTRTGYQLIGKPGYKAIGISGIGIYDGTGGANAAWCIPMRCYVWTASPYDLLDIYIWNQNTTSATSNTYIYVKILFIADTAI